MDRVALKDAEEAEVENATKILDQKIELLFLDENVLIVLLSLGGGSRGSTTKEGLASSAGAREGAELSLIGRDVGVPARNARVGRRAGRSGDGLEDDNVGLRRGVTG